jgi:hypothetical protein
MKSDGLRAILYWVDKEDIEKVAETEESAGVEEPKAE